MLETPSANVQTAVDEIKQIKSDSAGLAEKAQTGKISPQIAYGLIEDNEDRLAQLEARIKLLITTSPILQSNNEGINLIETEILNAKRKIFIAKGAAAGGVIQESSDASLFLQLQEFQARSA